MRILPGQGHEVIGLDILASPHTSVVGSIADRDTVRRSVAGVDAVVHCAHAAQAARGVAHRARTSSRPTSPARSTCSRRRWPRTSAGSSSRARRAPSAGRSHRPPRTSRRPGSPRTSRRYPATSTARPRRRPRTCASSIARDHGLPCLILRTSRFFPEPDDRDDVRSAYDGPEHQGQRAALPPGRRRGRRDRHLLALERAPAIGFGRYIISATSPFTPRRPGRRSAPTCRAVVRRLYPDFEEIYSARGWRMFPAIERVYVNERARGELGWSPRYDFRLALDRLADGRGPAQPAGPQHRRQGLPRGLDRRLHRALSLDHRRAGARAGRVADHVGRAHRLRRARVRCPRRGRARAPAAARPARRARRARPPRSGRRCDRRRRPRGPGRRRG